MTASLFSFTLGVVLGIWLTILAWVLKEEVEDWHRRMVRAEIEKAQGDTE